MAENPRIEELRRRVQADPASIAFAALAEEFRRVGRYEDAIETCRTGLQRHPAYLSARVTLGRALIETGDYEGAREELETVLRSAPENLAAIRGLATIHERLGHSTEMDPHLADLMKTHHAESIRVPVQPPPPPEPVVSRPIVIEDRGSGIEDPRSANPETIRDPRDSSFEPQFQPEPELQAEAQFQAEPELQPEPELELELEPTPIEDRGSSVEDRLPANPEAILDPRNSNIEPQFEPEPPPQAQHVEATPGGELPSRAEPELDLSLAPPLGVAPAPDPDLAMMLEPEPETEPEIEVVSGPDPAVLATLARLEQFLSAIQSLRA